MTDHVAPEQPESEQVNTSVAVGYNVAEEGETVSANADVSVARDRSSAFASDMYLPFGEAKLVELRIRAIPGVLDRTMLEGAYGVYFS